MFKTSVSGSGCYRRTRSIFTSVTHKSIVEKDPDSPVTDIMNPFEREKKVCLLCKYKIPVDYKNPKLLSQFVSPYTGYIYDKHITGLCDAQQQRLRHAILKAQQLAYMPVLSKTAKYIKDPKLYDAFKPSRPHPY